MLIIPEVQDVGMTFLSVYFQSVFSSGCELSSAASDSGSGRPADRLSVR